MEQLEIDITNKNYSFNDISTLTTTGKTNENRFDFNIFYHFCIDNLIGSEYPLNNISPDEFKSFMELNEIKKVVSLRCPEEVDETILKQLYMSLNIIYINIPIIDRKEPKLTDVYKFIDFINDLKTNEKCLIYCYAGRGRTITIIEMTYILLKKSLDIKSAICKFCKNVQKILKIDLNNFEDIYITKSITQEIALFDLIEFAYQSKFN